MKKELRNPGNPAFTLIELLVVIAIIALLISVLVPALSAARKSGQSAKCGANLNDIGKAMATYLVDSSGTFPFSYVYPLDDAGSYDLSDQINRPFGYLHWSHFLYSNGQASPDNFKCPSMRNGGAPRTNPGASDWEESQVDDSGNQSPSGSAIQDKQAPRIAYGGNAAVFPRNKFNSDASGGPRYNQFVNEKAVNTGRTILVAEFVNNWKMLGIDQGGTVLSKSHRSINPFWNEGSGSSEYEADPGMSAFTYRPDNDYGLRAQPDYAVGWIDTPGMMETNAVGRHHPGGDKFGGTANFLYADGHVERKTILQTVKAAEWGTRFFSLSGDNRVKF